MKLLLAVWGPAAALYLQIILHEAGHLLFGWLSGYTLTSFRIGKWMLIRREGGWALSRYHIPGTGGQCLMCPPEGDGCPALPYHLGGGLLNLILAGAAALVCLAPVPCAARQFLALFAACGALVGLINLIPMRAGGLDNDGRNAAALKKDPVSRWALAVQLRANAALAQGKTLSELPEEYFTPLRTAGWDGPLVGAVACIYAGRKMEQGDFAGAKSGLDRLLGCKKLNSAHRSECVLEQRCCRLLLGERGLEPLDKETERFRRATRKYFISRLRQEYVEALLQDGEKAQKIREEFERQAARSPYPGEAAGEAAIMDRALELFKKSSESGG